MILTIPNGSPLQLGNLLVPHYFDIYLALLSVTFLFYTLINFVLIQNYRILQQKSPLTFSTHGPFPQEVADKLN